LRLGDRRAVTRFRAMKKKTLKKSGARSPLRFAVAGLGHFAQAAVLPAFARATGCELRALFSSDEAKRRALARRYAPAEAFGYDDYEDFLARGEVDAVYIATPNDQHADFAIRAARAGVHVLCEKPLAPDTGAATRIVAACKENRVKLMVAYRLHFEAGNLEAIARLQRGDIGRPRFLSTTFALQVRPGNIRTKRARGGGPLLDLGVYCVNAARYLFRAEPTSVAAIAATTPGEGRFAEIDEQVTAILKFPQERTAQLTCSFGAYDHSTVTVVGTKGVLKLEPAYDYATDIALEVQAEGKRPSRKVFTKRDQVAAELVAFARGVRGEIPLEPSGEEGLADLRVMDAITRSLESGRVEAVAAQERSHRPSKRQGIRRAPHGMPPLVNATSGSR
jgi:glucose-fructose oxidoreductase